MQYSEENVEFFCHSDFTCNQFLPFENGNFDSYAVRKMPFDNFTISEFWFWQNIAIFQRWNVLKPKLRDRVANTIAGFETMKLGKFWLHVKSERQIFPRTAAQMTYKTYITSCYSI